MFTDLERSTALLTEVGPGRYAQLLDDHHAVIRLAVSRHGGVEVDTQGDGVFAAFASARRAVAAASEIQGALDDRLRLRIGLHTGEALPHDGRYVGLDVHRAARVGAAANGGQVLLTAATRDLLEPGVALRDLGLHGLRDLPEPEHLFQLGLEMHPELPTRLRSSLPVPPTAFLGRARELKEVGALLRRGDVRLLTLVGTGGTGKSRLALEVARRAASVFAGAVYWVPLGRVREPQEIVTAVTHALGLAEQPCRSIRDAVAARLAGAAGLVVLDNCEHLLPEVARDIAWLRDLSGPTVLVTSRERLRLDGEHVYEVPPLDGTDAVDLLLERAAALGVRLERSDEVAELCDRLDRLPLAIELAAARTTLLGPTELLGRIGERLDLLRGGRDADPRQATLRATIRWSYDLLTDVERRLLRSLAVFADGCTFTSAEAVCGADLETMQSLLDKSLVQRRAGESGATRFGLLETVREFAAEALEQCDEVEEARRRHAWHMAALGDEAGRWRPPGAWEAHVAQLADETDDLWAALAYAIETQDAMLRLRLAGAVALVNNQRLTRLRGPRAELEAALVAAAPVPPDVEARAQARIVEASWSLGEWEHVLRAANRSATLFRELGDELQLASILSWLGPALAYSGAVSRGVELLDEAIALYVRHGENGAATLAEINRSCTLLYAGDVASARVSLERADARGAITEAQSRVMRINLALCHVLEGDPEGAEAIYHEVLTELRLPAEERSACYAVEGLAAAWVDAGRRLEDAAALLAAAARARAELGAAAEPPERQLSERITVALRSALGSESYELAAAVGGRMSLRRAVARALALAEPGSATRSRG
jgi:predicted ATPase